MYSGSKTSFTIRVPVCSRQLMGLRLAAGMEMVCKSDSKQGKWQRTFFCMKLECTKIYSYFFTFL